MTKDIWPSDQRNLNSGWSATKDIWPSDQRTLNSGLTAPSDQRESELGSMVLLLVLLTIVIVIGNDAMELMLPIGNIAVLQ